jgi:TRAP-type mannitol/chloroaromatic compound transport system permease small subunit
MLAIARAIDGFTERSAIAFAWLLAPLLAAVAWEVVARYVFDSPTRWAYEAIYSLYAALFMLGAAYGLRVGAHVRTDFLWQKWRARTRALIEIVAYVALFFPGMLLFLFSGLEFTWDSWRAGERSADTAWMPPLWPLKSLVPLSCLLLLLQGLSELLKSVHAFRHER